MTRISELIHSVPRDVILPNISMKTDVPIYLLTGMTPDEYIFECLLPLLLNWSVVKWLDPHAGSSEFS